LHYEKGGKYIREEIKRKLTKEDADELNRQRPSSYPYRKGHETNAFNTRKELIKVTRAKWKKLCPDAIVLFEGSYGVMSPQICLSGPREIKKRLNEFVERANEVGWYEGDEEAMEKIDDEYGEYLEEVLCDTK